MKHSWYGESPAFRLALESGARARYGRALRATLDRGIFNGRAVSTLTYELDELDVPERTAPTKVVVQFLPSVPLFAEGTGVLAHDYPMVYADRELKSPHRLPGRALCLFDPQDPPSRRWLATRGLDDLLDLTARHLYLEDRWRGTRGLEWAADEAPHGMQPAA